MGTRADFYIKQEKNKKKMEWCGSIALDGYEIDGVEEAKTETEFRNKLKIFLDDRDDSTYPKDGWPWPWNNSKLTDETWVFITNKKGEGKVWRCYEKEGNHEDIKTPLIFAPFDEQPEYNEEKDEYSTVKLSKKIYMPDMKKHQNVAMDKRSGLLIISLP